MTADLDRLKARDEQAVADLLQVLRPRIDSIARSRGLSPMDADDIAAEACFRVLNNLDKIDKLETEEALAAYIHRVAQNAVLMNLRKRQQETIAAVEYEAGQTREKTLPAKPINPELLATVRNALEALPTAERTILKLHSFEGWTVSEIAKIMNLPVGSVGRRLSQAKHMLRLTLTQSSSGFDHER